MTRPSWTAGSASTNNQFGHGRRGLHAVGDNYIDRTYTDCADDPEGAISGDYDNCWAGNVVTMSLDGQSTPLVLDDSNGTWHEQQDSGDQIQYLTGTAANTDNGTYDNDYWVVTTPDGTQYYFGKNRGPGWASGDPVTNSTWTEPVYGAHSGDPCYNSHGFSQSSCTAGVAVEPGLRHRPQRQHHRLLLHGQETTTTAPTTRPPAWSTTAAAT